MIKTCRENHSEFGLLQVWRGLRGYVVSGSRIGPKATCWACVSTGKRIWMQMCAFTRRTSELGHDKGIAGAGGNARAEREGGYAYAMHMEVEVHTG
jgi:hypothetical protein